MARNATVVAAVAVALCAVLLSAQVAQAAQLKEIELTRAQYYIDVRLGFDRKPSYTESFRYDPDRYLLTFEGCGLAVPAAQLEALSEIDHHLLTRISTFAGTENLAVGFYLNLPVTPLIRYDQTSYTLRFYTAVRSEAVTQLGTGVSLIEKTSVYQGRNFHLYLVKVDPGASARLYAAAADRYDGKTRRRDPASFARREEAAVVINGGFFGSAGEHLSTLVEDGLIRATGVYPTRPLIVVTDTGAVLIGRYNVETALMVDGQRVPVSAKNYPFTPGKVMVYDHKYPVESLPQNGMFYYLLEGGKLRFYSYSTSGLWLAPEVLLIGTDIIPEANPLRGIGESSTVSLETRITDANGNVIHAQSAIGGAPMLIENGAVEISVAEDRVRADIAKSERSRTAVALTRSGQLLLAVVKEMESAGYGGVTLEVLSELLLAEGAYTAMNLDGGGSSAIVVAGEVLNLTESEQRAVSNVLVLALDESSKLAGNAVQTTPAPAANGAAATKYDRQE